MQPTEYKNKRDEELIAHIKQSLKTHEELYKLGAWEKFNEMQQTKKRPLFWLVRISAAAAILTICFSLIWYSTNSPQNVQLAKEKVKGSTPTSDIESTLDRTTGSAAQQLAMNDSKVKHSDHINKLETNRAEVIFAHKTNEPSTQVALNNDNSGTLTSPPGVVNSEINNQQVIAQVKENSKSTAADFLTTESQKSSEKVDKLALSKRQNRWDMGLIFAPSFGNKQELNIGYGLAMSYHLSDRVSLNSGISYTKMNASKNLPTNIGTSSIVLGNTKRLEMISEEVTGLDIPLELKYNINKNVYANLGISGFAVINQSRSNTFVETVVIKRAPSTTSSVGGSTGQTYNDALENQKGQFANAYLVNQRTTEAALGATETVNYIGFYNFSIGYTRKIYKNHAISIEPFVKLPIKNVTQDNLKLMGTGVRLKVGF